MESGIYSGGGMVKRGCDLSKIVVSEINRGDTREERIFGIKEELNEIKGYFEEEKY